MASQVYRPLLKGTKGDTEYSRLQYIVGEYEKLRALKPVSLEKCAEAAPAIHIDDFETGKYCGGRGGGGGGMGGQFTICDSKKTQDTPTSLTDGHKWQPIESAPKDALDAAGIDYDE